MSNYFLNFITEEDFEYHVKETIKSYNNVLQKIDLNKFNSNIVDPIKLVFDKNIFKLNYEEIINLEIQRQRDKSNNNSIGYFHQNIFRYIKNCSVPKEGWDIIFRANKEIYYVEMKNKHNTMNSSSSAKTFMKMQNHLLNSNDRETSVCVLVEVISRKSQNIEWVISIDKEKQLPNKRLRRISIDKFYEIVTGDKEAFSKLCKQLPITIEKIISTDKIFEVESDTVIEELYKLDKNILSALYKLAFKEYSGF